MRRHFTLRERFRHGEWSVRQPPNNSSLEYKKKERRQVVSTEAFQANKITAALVDSPVLGTMEIHMQKPKHPERAVLTPTI